MNAELFKRQHPFLSFLAGSQPSVAIRGPAIGARLVATQVESSGLAKAFHDSLTKRHARGGQCPHCKRSLALSAGHKRCPHCGKALPDDITAKARKAEVAPAVRTPQTDFEALETSDELFVGMKVLDLSTGAVGTC